MEMVYGRDTWPYLIEEVTVIAYNAKSETTRRLMIERGDRKNQARRCKI